MTKSSDSFQKKKRGRPEKVEKLIPQLKGLGVFNLATAKKLGISQPTLSRLVTTGKILQHQKGIYSHPEAEIPPEDLDFAVACTKFGKQSLVGGMSALFYYQLIDQPPNRIWIVVPYEVKTVDPSYRCIRSKTDSTLGVEDRGHYRMSSIDRTLVEALRYSTKIGLATALKAIRTAIKDKRTTLQKIHKQAKDLKLEKYVIKHWDAISPEGEAL